MSQPGTPLYRLEQAVGGKTGKEEVSVFAGDVIDCGGATSDLKKLRPGELVSLAASAIRKLCAGHKQSKVKEEEKTAQDQQALEEKDEMIRLQEAEIAKLKAEAEEQKKNTPPK